MADHSIDRVLIETKGVGGTEFLLRVWARRADTGEWATLLVRYGGEILMVPGDSVHLRFGESETRTLIFEPHPELDERLKIGE